MREVTIILKDATKRSELVDLLSTLPYVEAVQFEGSARKAANGQNEQPLPKNGIAATPAHERNSPFAQADPLDREVAFFEEQHEQLVKAFLGQYIAMHQGQVIAHHAELTPLVVNVRSSQPNAPVLFRQVQETLPPTLHFRSPRMVKR